MGDVIQFRNKPGHLNIIYDLIKGMAEMIESLPVDESAKLMQEVMAEQAGEASDLLKNYIETRRGAGDE